MSTYQAQGLPATCKGLVCVGQGKPLVVQQIPTPDARPGSVVVRVLAAQFDEHIAKILTTGTPGLAFPPTPFIPGPRAIGRVAAIGPDTTTLKTNQLVFLEPSIRGRDNPNVQILWGLNAGQSAAEEKLFTDSWRNGTCAEYVRAPLENCHPLNEEILMGSPSNGGFGYSPIDLCHIGKLALAYSGLQNAGVKAGDTVIVAPSTGFYTGGAVEVASAIGARVIALGRNAETLKQLADAYPRVQTHQLKGNVEEDTAALQKFGPIDAYLDISPGKAVESTHIRSCLMALKPHGKAVLMGVIGKDIAIPYIVAMFRNLTIRGQYMYDREDVQGMIKLVERGLLKVGASAGQKIVGQFALEESAKAIEVAKKHPGMGTLMAFTP